MDQLFELIALLRAAQVSHHHAHWTTKGPSFVGDHELFGELYQAIDPEFDTLAEKAVSMYGPKVVDPCAQLTHMYGCMKEWEKESNLVSRAILVERTLQIAFKTYIGELNKANELPIGVDNFIRQLADSHERALYKLGQRAS